jgi:iron(III) transport system ATP-binding protein
VSSTALSRREAASDESRMPSGSPGSDAAASQHPTGVAVRIVGLEKHFRREKGEPVLAIDHVSLDVAHGSMVTVLGPSGCGKTTLLRCIAGLETPSAGEIWSGGQLLSSGERGVIVPPERRQFGMMFQSYAVWPHMSVFGNVAYALKGRGWSRAEIEERVQQILRVVGIEHLRNEYPARMSGGQQQRVAFARSLVNEPKVMLFDEPLSNVDAKVREELRVELLAMQKKIGFAGVYVTHDQEEAMAISDLIVVMHEGRVLQVGTPQEIYRRPASRFVASFIGVANVWEGRLERGSSSSSVRCDFGPVSVATANVAVDGDDGDVVVVARPEALAVSRNEPAGLGHDNVWRGVLRAHMYRGAHTEVFVEVNGRVVRGRTADDAVGGGEDAIELGDDVYVVAPPSRLRVLPRADGMPAGQAGGAA